MKWTGKKKNREKAVSSSFQKELESLTLKQIIVMLLISCVMTLAGQWGITYMSNEINARRHLKVLRDTFLQIDDGNTEFLEDEQVMEAGIALLEDRTKNNEDLFNRKFTHFNRNCLVKNNYMITDTKQNLISSSYTDETLSSYFVNYIYAVCFRAQKTGNQVYRGVYFDIDKYEDTLYVKPLSKDNEVIGYITLVLSGSNWSYYMSEKSNDGIITDLRNNVMYASKRGFVKYVSKFYGDENGVVWNDTERYWVVSQKIESRNVIIYSLVDYPKSKTVPLMLGIVFIMGVVWYFIARKMSKVMAEKNSQSINQLVSEIRIIRKEDPKYRVEIEEENEFAEVGMQINLMLDAIDELNEKNVGLVKLNSLIELQQLTEQMNPHFLYNTLEIIRTLVLWDGEKAEQLIERLTDVLRYCVNKEKNEITLAEDMVYINKYLDIQYTRFGDRLKCDIDIQPECENVIVTRLLLQPFIENSIKYGFKNKMNIHIWITARMDGDRLVIRTRDDGYGMDEESAALLKKQLKEHDNTSTSIGLRNISRRLYLRYGQDSGIHIHNRPGTGFEVVTVIHINEKDRKNV